MKEIYVGAELLSSLSLPQISKRLNCTKEVAFIIRGQAKTIFRLMKEQQCIK
jgi:hypothetical protein